MNRYATAVKDLSWAGGIQDGVERAVTRRELKQEIKKARTHLLRSADALFK